MPSNNESCTLETARLRLDPVALIDAEDWWRVIWSDPDVTRFLPPRAPLPREGVDVRLAAVRDHWDTHGFGIWLLRDRSSGVLIGHCGLVAIDNDVELVYALARDRWGNGLAMEASQRVLAFGFDTLALPQIIAMIFPENTASGRVLEKLGFVRDGEVTRFETVLPRYVLCRGAKRDSRS